MNQIIGAARKPSSQWRRLMMGLPRHARAGAAHDDPHLLAALALAAMHGTLQPLELPLAGGK